MCNSGWFYFLLFPAWVGHFALIVGSHNWFYSKPFPRLIGDLVQVFHFLLGLVGLGWVFVGVDLLLPRPFISELRALSLIEIYSLISITIAFLGIPWFEFRRWKNKKAVKTAELEKRVFKSPFFKKWNHWIRFLPWNQSGFFEFKRVSLPIHDLPQFLEGFEILHLSDLHFGGNDSWEYFSVLFSEVARRPPPDVILFTGDLADSPEYLRWVVPLLGKIKARYGKFSVLGNHDFWNTPNQAVKVLRKAGFHCLGNEEFRLNLGEGKKVYLAGNETPWNKQAIQRKLKNGSDFSILLTHTPDQAVVETTSGFDLAFAGHVHGGQICIPIVGPILLPSAYGRLYDQGFYKIRQLIMHVSRGVAGSFPYRLNCLPEVSWIRLLRG